MRPYWLPNVSSAIARLRAFSIRLSGRPCPNRPRSTKNREVGRFGLTALSPRHVGGTGFGKITSSQSRVTTSPRSPERTTSRTGIASELEKAPRDVYPQRTTGIMQFRTPKPVAITSPARSKHVCWRSHTFLAADHTGGHTRHGDFRLGWSGGWLWNHERRFHHHWDK